MDLEPLLITLGLGGAMFLAIVTQAANRLPVERALGGSFAVFKMTRRWQVVVYLFSLALGASCLDKEMARAGLPVVLIVAGIAVVFTRAWAREFLFLMALRDEDLPGRFDKMTWAFVLIALAPVGLFLFRSHRLAHWPEPEPKPRMARDPGHELA